MFCPGEEPLDWAQVSTSRRSELYFLLILVGFIGKVTLQIPFYRPHVDPWVISVSKLHLIGSPEKQEDFDEERERLLERENKKAILLALEEKWRVSHLEV